jgi:hypothetical protein
MGKDAHTMSNDKVIELQKTTTFIDDPIAAGLGVKCACSLYRPCGTP